MSFDVGLFSFSNGEHGTIPSSLLLEILAPFIKKIDEQYWELKFPDGGGGELSAINEGDDCTDFWVMRAGGVALYDALFAIMRQTHTVMLWIGGGDTMITADPTIAGHLPTDFVNQFGIPTLVHSAADILAEIAKT